jgi:hypothetical protein
MLSSISDAVHQKCFDQSQFFGNTSRFSFLAWKMSIIMLILKGKEPEEQKEN